jgi:hypothetical protein
VHYQTRSWALLSYNERDAKLVELGISNDVLLEVRKKSPRSRILEAAKIALTIDDEPNSDLIEYIAGYAPRSAVYHHFSSMTELYDCLGIARQQTPLAGVSLPSNFLDLTTTIPRVLANTSVHMDEVERGKRFLVWQKLNGGMRSVVLNRGVHCKLFLAGVVLYAGEGTKSLKSGRVEVANSNPGVLALHIRFMSDLGIPKNELRARVQIHNPSESFEAKDLWSKELNLSPTQFRKPLLSTPGDLKARHTFTLQLSYANMMLLTLLRHWTENVDTLVRTLDDE